MFFAVSGNTFLLLFLISKLDEVSSWYYFVVVKRVD